ncbi:MAG: hypothetical protein ACK47B_03660 [Armatimonadota bacterium]
MPEEVMVVATVAILCGTGTLCFVIHSIKSAIVARSRGQNDDAVLQELRELRAEIGALRQQNNDVVLTLDSSLDRIDRRVSHLETRSRTAEPERQQVGLGR